MANCTDDCDGKSDFWCAMGHNCLEKRLIKVGKGVGVALPFKGDWRFSYFSILACWDIGEPMVQSRDFKITEARKQVTTGPFGVQIEEIRFKATAIVQIGTDEYYSEVRADTTEKFICVKYGADILFTTHPAICRVYHANMTSVYHTVEYDTDTGTKRKRE